MKRALRTVPLLVVVALFVSSSILWVRSYFVQDIFLYEWKGQAVSGVPVASSGFFIRSAAGRAVLDWDTFSGKRSEFHVKRMQGTGSNAIPRFGGWWRKNGIRLDHEPPFLGITRWELHLSYWMIALPTAGIVAVWIVRRWRRRFEGANRCKACGYDLRATPDRCPECGAVPASNAHKEAAENPTVGAVA